MEEILCHKGLRTSRITATCSEIKGGARLPPYTRNPETQWTQTFPFFRGFMDFIEDLQWLEEVISPCSICQGFKDVYRSLIELVS